MTYYLKNNPNDKTSSHEESEMCSSLFKQKIVGERAMLKKSFRIEIRSVAASVKKTSWFGDAAE